MNAVHIVKAIQALDEARDMLRRSCATIYEYKQTATHCSDAAIELENELRKIEVPIERESA